MDVATLLKQLGPQFFLATGFKAECRGENFVQFKATKNKLGANKMTIRLVNDTYTIEFGRVRKFEYTIIKTIEDVYCDQLVSIFESETGLCAKVF